MSSLPSLKQRGLRAGAWVAGSQIMNQVLRLASNLLLARLLLPEAFGLMAVISTLLMMMQLFTDIGSGVVIIQSPRGDDKDFLNTAWTLQIARGIALWLVAVLLSLGLVFAQQKQWFVSGAVYDDPRLPTLLAVAAIASIINGLATVNAKLAERNLDFAALSMIEVGVSVGSIVLMAIGAYYTGSVWVLVAGNLVAAAGKCVLGHWLLKGPPVALKLDADSVKELIGKGKWVVVSSVLGLTATSGDKLLLGGIVDSTTLGLYSIAFGLASIASTAMGALLGKVVFPIFSEVVRKRKDDLGRTYRRLQQSVDACVGVIAGFVYVASTPIVSVLYDERYQGAAHILSILAIGSLGIRFVVVEQVYVAMGKTSLLAVAGLPRALIILVGVPVGYSLFKLDGALMAVVASQFVHWPLAIWFRVQHKLNSILSDVVLPPAILTGLLLGWGAVKANAAYHGS